MEQYIPKSALVAEITKIYDRNRSNGYIDVCDEIDDILSFLDTLEVKEIDLEKEINKYISNNFFGSQTLGFFANRTEEEPDDQDIALCAKHFFELGLKAAQRGEEI